MKINRQFTSPNFDPAEIPVEFMVLHYTAGDLDSTIELFLDPGKEVSSHLILDEDGSIYELVSCWEGNPQRAWHAVSHAMETSNRLLQPKGRYNP